MDGKVAPHLVFLALVRIVSEYEAFKARAVTVPEDSREMMDLISYMAEARDTLISNLHDSVRVRLQAQPLDL